MDHQITILADRCLQLFRERSVKAYAPMPNGFMGNASYCCLIDLVVAFTR